MMNDEGYKEGGGNTSASKKSVEEGTVLIMNPFSSLRTVFGADPIYCWYSLGLLTMDITIHTIISGVLPVYYFLDIKLYINIEIW